MHRCCPVAFKRVWMSLNFMLFWCRNHRHQHHYVPVIEDIRRLRAVQCAHTQKILEVISPQDAYRLGFHDLSAEKASTEWAAKHGQGTVHHLEGGLAHKVEGLESVRREKLPSSRMYQLSEYYYKVQASHTYCPLVRRTDCSHCMYSTLGWL